MSFKFVHSGWDRVFRDAAKLSQARVRIICPFVQDGPLAKLTEAAGDRVQLITRLNVDDFNSGVSNTTALRRILQGGGAVRGVKNLHAKLYIFGDSRVVVTSANLTDRALQRNHEFGMTTDDRAIVLECADYFDGLWRKAKPDLTFEVLAKCEADISTLRRAGGQPRPKKSRDYGIEVGFTEEEQVSEPVDTETAYVKFFATGDDRRPSDTQTIHEVDGTGSHWSATFPLGKRPRQIADGTVMFLACLVPGDILVYGRAIAERYVDGRDDASESDIALRPWRATWPHYNRLHDAEFVAGTISNGVSLRKLMSELRENAFASTQRNARVGTGNTDPTMSIRRQPGVRLSPEGYKWLSTKLSGAFATSGKVPERAIARLDRPPY